MANKKKIKKSGCINILIISAGYNGEKVSI